MVRPPLRKCFGLSTDAAARRTYMEELAKSIRELWGGGGGSDACTSRPTRSTFLLSPYISRQCGLGTGHWCLPCCSSCCNTFGVRLQSSLALTHVQVMVAAPTKAIACVTAASLAMRAPSSTARVPTTALGTDVATAKNASAMPASMVAIAAERFAGHVPTTAPRHLPPWRLVRLQSRVLWSCMRSDGVEPWVRAQLLRARVLRGWLLRLRRRPQWRRVRARQYAARGGRLSEQLLWQRRVRSASLCRLQQQQQPQQQPRRRVVHLVLPFSTACDEPRHSLG